MDDTARCLWCPSQERVVCTAKLGPSTGEYFFAYREQVEQAPEANPRSQTARIGEVLAAPCGMLGKR